LCPSADMLVLVNECLASPTDRALNLLDKRGLDLVPKLIDHRPPDGFEGLRVGLDFVAQGLDQARLDPGTLALGPGEHLVYQPDTVVGKLPGPAAELFQHTLGPGVRDRDLESEREIVGEVDLPVDAADEGPTLTNRCLESLVVDVSKFREV